MRFNTSIIFVALLMFAIAFPAPAEIVVVTTTRSLADIAERIGGDQVKVQSLMRGNANAHNVAPKPSYVMKLRKADLFVHSGLDGEPWVASLLKSARKSALLPGGAANADASTGVTLLEVPMSNELTRAMGDIHVYGNPHYLLDPLNGVRVGYTLASHFARLDPAKAAEFESRAKELDTELNRLTTSLVETVNALELCPVVTYHRTWSYFLKRFEIEKLGELEPKPGIASGPRHISTLAEEMKRTGSRLVISASYEDRRIAGRLEELVGGQHIILAQDVGALPEASSYSAMFEFNVKTLAEAAQKVSTTEGDCR